MTKLTRGIVLAFALAVLRPAMANQEHIAVGLDSIPVCYDFGCKVSETIGISREDWDEVAGWFNPPAKTAEEERIRIRNAIGWMEVVVGRYTPTHRDKGSNIPRGETIEWPGQLDCIDESLNTTTYLKLLEKNGLFRWHQVVERAYRRSLFDQHWAGQIEEFNTGDRYVVDSWYQDNGQLPFIQDSPSWTKIPFFFTSYLYNGDE